MFVCPVPKISQVMIKWRRRASHLGRFTLWHSTAVAELQNSVEILCDTLAAELHNSVNLPCGTIDCLQYAFSLLNPSSSYLIQRDCKSRRYYYLRELDFFFSVFTRACNSKVIFKKICIINFDPNNAPYETLAKQ